MTVIQLVHSARLRSISPFSSPGVRRLVGSGVGGWVRRAATALLLPLVLLATWSLVARYELVAPQILPCPSIVWATAIDLLASGQLQSELLVSLMRVAAGLSIGGAAGLAAGIGMGLSRTAEAYLAPTLRAIWLVPALGWLPFFMLVFGIGEELKIVLIAKACFLPAMVNSFDGVRTIPRRHH